ncbi:hypothetical protein IAT38_000104 [Cryptococcus sp. DSM 104549]
MPKAPKPVPRPLTKPKLATKSTRVSPNKPSPPSPDSSSPATHSPHKADAPVAADAPDSPGAGTALPTTAALDKDLVLRIILAKLEASKTCDWYELSLKLAEEGELSPGRAVCKAAGKGRGKGQEKLGKKGRKSEEALSGAELFDLYHNRILPALKAGRPLWREDEPRQISGSSTGSAAAVSDSALTMPLREEGKGKSVLGCRGLVRGRHL